MAIINITANAVIPYNWTDFKSTVLSKTLSIQYDDDGVVYTIFAFDGSYIAYTCTIWKATVPDSVINGGYSQAQNDSDKSNFETNYKPYANMPVNKAQFDDPRLIHKLGNITTTSTSEVLVSSRPYTQLSSQRQCSVQSSSNQDKSGGTGSVAVRITYLDSNYILKTEDLNLNGTTKVNTVASDIRFIENFQVIQGAAAVGAISLMDGTGGGASEFCGIASGTTEAFLCHHYVPAGKRAWVTHWCASGDDEIKLKLYGQERFGSNLVDVILDLVNLNNGNAASLSTVEFHKYLTGVMVPEKTYIRVTVVPNQSTSTITRAILDIFEDVT